MAAWSTADARELYGIDRWGRDLFGVNADGHLVVTPYGAEKGAIDVRLLADELVERGIDLPILLRFPDLVRRRVETLAACFTNAFAEYGYTGRYRGVYPIKVNQQRHLVESIVKYCRPLHMGLEAGSKPELLITLALLDDPEALIICNGYKDADYVETAMLAQKLGRNTIVVVEKLSEVATLVKATETLGIRPRIGVRAKLSQAGTGRWKSSSGDRAKFGLSAWDLVRLVRQLEQAGMLDCLQLLHFHVGSQVTNIRTFKQAMVEASRTYVELVRLGAPMGILDVGGGLGVDYDGSRSNFESSMNYSEAEYAYDVVAAIQEACATADVAEPDIVTESGRATVAHHSLLVFDVLGVERLPTAGKPVDVAEDAPHVVKELRQLYDQVNPRTCQEVWHDALQARETGRQSYNLGMINLEQRAAIERLFWQVCGRIRTAVRKMSYVPDELADIERRLADTYYANFSVFQSVPDAWAIDQLFPVVPVQRLDERPLRRGVLADLTCDSDGKLDRFISLRDVKDVLELHETRPGETYLLGIALVGAYQEILGDLHNLFGDTNAVHVQLEEGGGYRIERVLEGDSVTDVLGYVQYDRRELVHRVRAASERAMRDGVMTREESKMLLHRFTSGLDGYTYLRPRT
ncbi:MAG: arginine decarboxylase [Myxococcota bacterium]|jgi:arginine decarboxylase